MISQSVLIERMKINGSLARKAMRTLEDMGLIKKVVHHHGQWVYSAYPASAIRSNSGGPCRCVERTLMSLFVCSVLF